MLVQNVSKNMWHTRGRLNFPLHGLVLYLPLWHPELPDDTTIYSKDLNHHECTITGTVHVPRLGRYFDVTDDRVDCGSSSLLRMTTDTTILAWVRTTDLSAARSIVSKSNVSAQDRLDMFFHSVGGGRFDCFKESANDGGITLAGGTPLVNTWYFFAVRIGSLGFGLWVDDNLIGSDVDTAALTDGTHTNLFLARNYNNTNPLGGDIGVVWMYNWALSTIEMARVRKYTRWRYQ